MSNKITLMDEAVDTENITMQQISGMGIMETEDVSADDLLYLINKTNESNETYVSEAERMRKEEKLRMQKEQEEEEELRRQKENEERFAQEERTRLERIRQEEEMQVKAEDTKKADKERLREEEKQKKLEEARLRREEKLAAKQKAKLGFKLAAALFILYNFLGIGTALFLIYGGIL